MTPEEKAKELYEKFIAHSESFHEEEHTKQCALICCDEILSHMLSTHYVPFDIMHPNVKYWYEVK